MKILMDQAVDNTTVLYWAILCLVLALCVGFIGKFKKGSNQNTVDVLSNAFVQTFINMIYDDFIDAAEGLIAKMELAGITTYEEFENKVKDSLFDILKGFVTKAIGNKVKYADSLQALSDTALRMILEQIFEDSIIENWIETRYDELVNAVEKSAEEYENEVSKENKSFENGTAKVPEYVEEVEEKQKEDPEEVDESELEEPV